MFPPAPQFGALRLATLVDLPRIAIVAASGFYHSSWFQYERPYYKQYPLDTLASYRNSYRNAIINKDAIVLVAEATLKDSEKDGVYEALAKAYPPFEEQIPKESLETGRAIVAVASFSLLPDSQRHGQFQPTEPAQGHLDHPPEYRDENSPKLESMEKPLTEESQDGGSVGSKVRDTPLSENSDHADPDPELKNRDKDPRGSELMDKTLHPREVEQFKGRMVIDTMVTHPAYWRHGHATEITKWFLSLADMDKASLGVAGAPMGKIFFGKIDFKEVEMVEIPGYEAHPEPVYAWLGIRESQK